MRIQIILLSLCFFANFFVLQAQQDNIEDVNRLYEYYCKKKLFANASNLLVSKGNEYLDRGDTLTAFELQLRNCHLTDKHLKEFFKSGLTWEGYFADWYMTISLAAWLNKEEEFAPELLRILEMISQKEPRLLPFYASTLGYILYEYKDENNENSICVLQKALDYIKSVNPSPDLVKQYNEITDCFYANRWYNSVENNILLKNRFDELEKWYTNNLQYMKELDDSLYKDEILEYELLFVDQVMYYASAVNAQEDKPYDAIKMYDRVVSIIEPLIEYKSTLSQKIAACYAHIAMIYFSIGNPILSKEYSDRAFPYLVNHNDDFDYCDILRALSWAYFNTNQYELASQLKLEEILLRDALGWHCSLGDWSLYFMYLLTNFEPETVIKYKDFALAHSKQTESGDSDFYLNVGKAFSLLMKENLNYKDSAELYFNKANNVFISHKEYNDKYNLSEYELFTHTQAWAGHYLRLGQVQDAYSLYKKALSNKVAMDNYNYFATVSLLASYLHDTDNIHLFLPVYFNGMIEELYTMLPILGSMESDIYLSNGESDLYHMSERASWNPTDSVSVCIAYDAALLMKGLTLRYNILTSYFEDSPEMANAKLELDKIRDSIYAISDDNERMLAAHRYRLKEREILKEVKDQLINVHWEDVSKALDDNEACIEFVKYTANRYSWCDSTPKPHYSAMVLLSNDKAPIFVDLFDEDDLLEVYELQPKSYDQEIGQMLYSKIWGKMQRYIEGKDKVFFSPMGLLNLINIELLTDSTGKTAAERFNLYRVSSTRNIIKKYENRGIHIVASFGGVDFENTQEYADMMRSISTRGNWAYLQNTLLEVNRIEKLLKGSGVDIVTYTGPQATESAFKQLDRTQANIIHVATHGYYIPQSQRSAIPYFAKNENTENIQDELFYSGLILSGGQKAWTDSTFMPDNNDGILTAYEISKLDLHNVNLVVLSACETGLGDNLFDGIFGLQRAFKKAGAGAILMSLWQIDDKATSEYMSLFYEKLVKGYSKHDAYISTVLSMKEKYPDATYWASFVLLD